MKQLPHRQALIFDMDGVLWDSSGIHHKAYCDVLEPLGVVVGDYAALAGRRTDDVIRALLAQSNRKEDEQGILRLTQAKQLQAREALRRNPPITPGCRTVLEKLRGNHLLALASSASRGSVNVFLETSQTVELFSVVVCGDDVQYPKPAPDIYLLALQQLGLTADSAYVIEDSLNGIRAALAAGVQVIGYRTGPSIAQVERQLLGDIHSLEELLNYERDR